MKSSMETRLKHIIPHNFVNNRRKYTKLAHMIGHDPPCWFMLILWHLLSDYKGRFLQLPVLLDTFFGKFTTSPAPANVGLQDDMDIILFVINNIGRGRKTKKNQRHCSGEVSQLIMTGSVHLISCSLKIILGSCLRGRLLNGFFPFFLVQRLTKTNPNQK